MSELIGIGSLLVGVGLFSIFIVFAGWMIIMVKELMRNYDKEERYDNIITVLENKFFLEKKGINILEELKKLEIIQDKSFQSRLRRKVFDEYLDKENIESQKQIK